MKKCPYCAEEIQDEAMFCRYCHHDLNVPQTPQSPVYTPTSPSTLTGQRAIRSETVGTAVILLYISLVLSAISGFYATGMEMKYMSQNTSINLVPLLFMLVIEWFIISNIARGKNWARIINLVLFLIGTACVSIDWYKTLDTSPLMFLLFLGQIILNGIALVFLFQKSSNQWFGRK